ncbi:MAG TPA: DNA polymerase III subunit epsilon [Gammaproteobacteria bacterium]|nr:DNA polymerase III subunit epsilon [Gammaproteobacteria bacterium]
MRQIVLDTETTGIRVEDGHRIIEIGCLELVNRKLTGTHFHCYINPERDVEPGALAVHGITNEFLKDKPTFDTIVNGFIDFISGDELIIHNAPFDLAFIDYEFSLMQGGVKKLIDHCRVIDTLQMARKLHVGQRNSLDALCKRYGVDRSKRNFHGALLDAYLLAQVYLMMTGGQGSFFDSLSENRTEDNPKQSKQSTAIANQTYRLTVLQANSIEIAEHEQYLERMKESGKCLWVDVFEK